MSVGHSDVVCDFCGADATSGRGFLTGQSAAVCEQCIRGMYWRVQEESWPGKCWRALGLTRSPLEVQTRLWIAVLPSMALAWIAVDDLALSLAPSPSIRRILSLLGYASVCFVLTLLILPMVEGALTRKGLLTIMLLLVWVGPAWWLSSQLGVSAGFVGAAAAGALLYFVVRLASSQHMFTPEESDRVH